MSIFLIVLILVSIIGGILLLKKTAKKFNLTAEQLKEIKERNDQIEKKEQEEDD